MGRVSKKSPKSTTEQFKTKRRDQQRRRRENFTAEQLEHKRAKDRERYHRLKTQNQIKSIEEKTPREQRKIRKCWKKNSKRYRLKKKAEDEAINNTPPDSENENLILNEESIQKIRGRKKVRKDKAKVYRVVTKQKQKIEELERRLEKYKKRLQREKQKQNVSPSPKKLVKNILGKEKVSPMVKKALFLGCVLKKQVETQIKEAGGQTKKKQLICKAVGNKIFKKYRVQKYFQNIIPYTMNKTLTNTDINYVRSKRTCIRRKINNTLLKFFEDDTVSKMCPGKRDFVKNKKLKKQRRILLDTMDNLYKMFVDKYNVTISKSTFYRARPFWVTYPKKSDRDTCACIKHTNMCLMIEALKKNSLIKQKSSNEVLASVVCTVKQEDCMMGLCNDCKTKTVEYINDNDEDFNVKFFKWRTVKEERVIKGQNKFITKTVKVKQILKLSEFKIAFERDLAQFKKHVYFAYHQASQLKDKVNGLKSGELAFRIDFSENYIAKYGQEVQSAHFGASKRQICLNTGVRYARRCDGKLDTFSFATASDNLDHNSHAVWAHLDPILKKTANDYPETTTIHFFSDSPSSQYRNRTNIYLMKKTVPIIFPNLKFMTWNFTEAGHGKGPMDGVGGSLKRGADYLVAHGNDICKAAHFVSMLANSKIFLKEIPSKDIENMKLAVSKMKISPIKGIMQVRQVTFTENIMFIRRLSCFECPLTQYCDHFTIKEIFVEDPLNSEEEQVYDPPKAIKVQRRKRPLLRFAEEMGLSDSDEDWTPEPKTKRHQLPTNSVQSVRNVYSSSEDDTQTPGPSNSTAHKMTTSQIHNECDEDNVRMGSFLLVRLNIENKSKKLTYRQFVAVSQSSVRDGELEVMFLKSGSSKSMFSADETDVSIIDFNQIVAVLPTPTMVVQGDRIFYKFMYDISVC